MKTLSECKFSEQFESYFVAGSEQAAQQFYVTASKANRAVVRQIGSAMSGRKEQYMFMAPLHPMLICHGNRGRLAESVVSFGVAMSLRGNFSAEKLDKLSPE